MLSSPNSLHSGPAKAASSGKSQRRASEPSSVPSGPSVQVASALGLRRGPSSAPLLPSEPELMAWKLGIGRASHLGKWLSPVHVQLTSRRFFFVFMSLSGLFRCAAARGPNHVVSTSPHVPRGRGFAPHIKSRPKAAAENRAASPVFGRAKLRISSDPRGRRGRFRLT